MRRDIVDFILVICFFIVGTNAVFVTIPGCQSLYQFDFQNSDDNIPRCYCDNATDTSLDLVQINCIYQSTLKDLSEAIRRVVKAKKHLTSVFIERMTFNDDGLPDDYFMQHKVTPTEISIVKCDGNGINATGRLIIRNNTFRGLENNITKLTIKECRLSTFPENIRRLPMLQSLELDKTSIRTLGTNDLSGLSKLEYLDLSGNGIQTIEPNSFRTLVNLKMLKLGPGNNLNSSIFGEINRYLPQITDLDLSSNNVTQMPKRALALTQNLQTLNLANNNIYVIKNETFVGLNRLRTLDLRVNLIHQLESDAFVGLEGLNELYLAGNYLTEINGELLKMPKLTTLDVGYNNFVTLPANTFKRLTRLVELDLRKNEELSDVNEDAFVGLKQLQYANLSNTNISHLDEDLLQNVPKLRSLDISNTKISSLDKDVFVGSKNLNRLSIATTKITTLPEGIFDPLTQLTDLDLSGNNWLCDAKLLWLSKWLVDKLKNSTINIHAISDVTCLEPEELRNKPLVRLIDSKFPIETTTTTTPIATTNATVATLNVTQNESSISNFTTKPSSTPSTIGNLSSVGSLNETSSDSHKAPTPAAVENGAQSTKEAAVSSGWSNEDKTKVTIIIAVVVVAAACATIAIVVAIVVTMKKKRRKASRLAALKNFVPTSTMNIEMCQRQDNSRLSDIEIIRDGQQFNNNYKIHQPGALYAEIMLQHQKDAQINNNNNTDDNDNDSKTTTMIDEIVSTISVPNNNVRHAKNYRDTSESPLPPPPPPPPHHHL